jgi:uncharacterized protein (DUF58 family)
VALALVLFYYAANSEVAWLFLFAYWIVAIVVASFFYARWNRGFFMGFEVVDTRHASDDLPEGAPDAVYERDAITVRQLIRARRGWRGPVSIARRIGELDLRFGAGLVGENGVTEDVETRPLARGPLTTAGFNVTGDPLGFFARRRPIKKYDVCLALPRFTTLSKRPMTREVEAAVTAPRAGSGTEIFGVREYRPGDALRRIHWRSTARRGELIVREFEPPGVQNLSIFLDPNPPTVEAADQVARLAASEAWDCLRAGGRVTLWAPGCEPTRPDEGRNFEALLEWLARYPNPADEDEPAPLVGDAIAVTATSDARLLDATEDVRAHGGSVRAWAVGDAVLESDVDVERAGLDWPL